MNLAGLHRAAVLAVATIAGLSLGVTVSAQSSSDRRQMGGATAQTTRSTTTGIVSGTAWKNDYLPYPNARLRLRNLETGRPAARADADAQGRFRFVDIATGTYVIELLSEQDKVLGIGDLFSVMADREIATLVRLGSKAPWYGGFFGNVATAVLSAASSLGITALGSNGQPASAQ